MKLQDKVIIVTGSTQGIGRAIAERCVAEGARVLVHGLDREKGEAVRAALGEQAALHIDNLADPEAPGRLAAATREAFGRIDAVVNNAASITHSDLHTAKAESFDAIMAVNVRAPLLLIQAAFPELKKVQGCVLNIGSINAHSGEPGMLEYSISKGALQTLSRNLANALTGDRVRVNHFNVGWVLSDGEYELQRRLGQPEDWPERVPPVFAPAGRLIRPEEIAAAAVYWLSDESGPISGTVLELEQFPVIGRNPSKV